MLLTQLNELIQWNSMRLVLYSYLALLFIIFCFCLKLVYDDFKNKQVKSSLLYSTSILTWIVHIYFMLRWYNGLIYLSLWVWLILFLIEKSVFIVNKFTDKYKWTDWFLWDWDKYFWFITFSLYCFLTIIWVSYLDIPIFFILIWIISIIQFILFEKNKKERKVSLFPALLITSIFMILWKMFYLF